MIVLSARDLSKSYGTDVILEKISFHINKGERVGIVGRNGAGKTTLLNILTGELPYDSGELFISKDTKIGYLKQRDGLDENDTVLNSASKIFKELSLMEEEILILSEKIEKDHENTNLLNRMLSLQSQFENLGGYTYKSEITGILTSMGFGKESLRKKISTLSGGEKTRLSLAMLLLEKPDILILDEPTNHLDIHTLRWLEQYLSQYKGTLIVVSHDRYFLDKVVNRVFEVVNHHVETYKGNYSQYAVKKREIRQSQMKAYNNQQREIRRQEDMIRTMRGHNTEKLVKRARSREKRLDMIERLEKPEKEAGSMKIRFREDFPSGNDVIMAKDLSKSIYQELSKNPLTLFKNVNLDIKRGERICIVGKNGIGKTTLLKMILGESQVTSGNLRIGHNVAIGYYDQGQRLLNENNTVFDEMKDEYRLYKDREIRTILGSFLFKGEDVFLEISCLSGGEKARLSLAKLMLSNSNTLILDEPTNHLDIESKEVFEEALLDYPGTVIVVSHDRYFLTKIPTRILELTEEGMVEYLGNYDYYMEKKEQEHSLNFKDYNVETEDLTQGDDENLSQLSSQEERALKKKQEAEMRRLNRKREKLEKDIEIKENEISKLENDMTLVENLADFEKLNEMSLRVNELKDELESLYEEWAEIS